MKTPASLSFEVLLNGRRAALASSHGMSVISAILSWVGAAEVRHPGGPTHSRPEALDFSVGGLAQDRGQGRVHVKWLDRSVKAGDLLTIRIVKTGRTQRPKTRTVESKDMIEASERRYFRYLKKKYAAPRRSKKRAV